MPFKYKHLTIFQSQEEKNKWFDISDTDLECDTCEKKVIETMEWGDENVCQSCFEKTYKDDYMFIDISPSEAQKEYQEYQEKINNETKTKH